MFLQMCPSCIYKTYSDLIKGKLCSNCVSCLMKTKLVSLCTNPHPTPAVPELLGEQPPCHPVSGVPAEPGHGGVLQGGLLLRRGRQVHQTRGLFRHLCRVHVQVWGESLSAKCIFRCTESYLSVYSRSSAHFKLVKDSHAERQQAVAKKKGMRQQSAAKCALNLKTIHLNKPKIIWYSVLCPAESSQWHTDSREPQKPQTVLSSGLVEARHSRLTDRSAPFHTLLSATKVPKSHTETTGCNRKRDPRSSVDTERS